MKVLIIEDEAPAARRLTKLLKEANPAVEVLQVIESVRAGERWFSENPLPDLVLSDIQLSDDLSFELFRKLQLNLPIIFTTAYDEYAIQAFEHNSIDYLLKPIGIQDLSDSLSKFSQQQNKAGMVNFDQLIRQLQQPQFRERFLVNSGNHLIPIAVQELAYCYAEEGVTFIKSQEGKRFLVADSLDHIEKELDPKHFFRANRQMILSASCVQSVEPYFNQKLKVHITPPAPQEVVISKLKATAFKNWLDQ